MVLDGLFCFLGGLYDYLGRFLNFLELFGFYGWYFLYFILSVLRVWV